MTKKLSKKNNSILIWLCLIVATITGASLGLYENVSNSGLLGNYKPNVSEQIERLFTPAKEVKVPILVYHYVEYVKDSNDIIRKSLSTTPLVLENQIKTLLENGYELISFKRLDQYLEGIKPLPKKSVILTFDDGYEDFYTDVLPILKKYKVNATQYLVSGFVGKRNYMNEFQVKEIIKSGLVEIGAHTVSHDNLKLSPDNIAIQEIEQSKKDIEKKYNISVTTFAYPYGDYNERTPGIVKRAGFKTAVTVEDGFIISANERFTLFRIHPGIDVGSDLLKKL